MAYNADMATVTKTLKLPFLKVNAVKAAEFERLERLNTEVANRILAMPKPERRNLTTKAFSDVEIGSAWMNQTIRNANTRTKARRFRRLPLETNNQNWPLHKTGGTFSVSFGLRRGVKKRIPLEVHAASHAELLDAALSGTVKTGSIKLVRSRKGLWYACLSVSKEVPDAVKAGQWVGVDRGQNIPVVAATPAGPVVFWKAPAVRNVRRIHAQLRETLQKRRKTRAVKKLESKERRVVAHVNHCISKGLVAMAVHLNAGIRIEDLSGIRSGAKQRKKTKADAGQNRDFWPFFQLESFIRYKAMAAGVAVEKVPPAYTSKSCHRCGALGIRNKHAFICPRCGYKAHADANAGMNIRDWHGLCCPLVLDVPAGGPYEPALNPVSEASGKPDAQQERESHVL